MRLITLLTCLAFLAARGIAGAQTSDVARDHWAYSAVSELAARGFVLGYPDGKFLGDRTLTRYEMATIIKRVIDRIEAMPRLEESLPTPAEPAREAAPAAPPTITPDDLAEVRRLVDEYKVELAVIGADLKSAKERLDKLEGDVASVRKAVEDPKGAIQTAISDVKKMKKIVLSGYAQVRYTDDQSSTLAKNSNTFNVRRARLKVTGRPSANSAVVFEPDFGGTAVTTKQAYIDYYVKGDPTAAPTLTFGQMKWPFGYQNVQSSAARETPEEADVINAFLPGEYDRGVKLTTATGKRFFMEAGLFNGVQAGNSSPANKTDDNFKKDITGRLRYKVSSRLDMGASWYFGRTPVTAGAAPEFTRDFYGADAEYVLKSTSLKAEYLRGNLLGAIKDGYWAQITHNFTTKDIGVVMYDVFNDPSNTTNGDLNNWNVGYIRRLDEATRLKLFYEIRNEERAKFNNNILTAEVITLF